MKSGFFKNLLYSVVSIIVATVLLLVITVSFSSCGNFQKEDDTVIADNCVVFNPERAEDEIIACDENSMTIKTIYGLTNGTVLSCGITSKTPHGVLRKIDHIDQVDNGYKVYTTQAALCEAIKECNLHYSANIHPDGSYDIVNKDTNTKSNAEANAIIQQAYADPMSIGQEFPFESKLFEGKFGYAINFDLDIHWGHVYIKVTGEIYATAALKDFTRMSTGDIDIPAPNLPDVTFWAGPVPIVITNDLGLSCNCTAELLSFKVKAQATIDKEAGFEYCTDWGIRPINEDHSSGPELSYHCEENMFRGTLNASFTAKYTGKVYGIAGFSIGVSLVDELNLKLKKLESWEDASGCIHLPGLNWDLKGNLHNKIYIPISGNFTIGGKIDIFGLKFDAPSLDCELFNTEDAITLYEIDINWGDLDNDPDFNATNQIVMLLDVSGSMSGEPLSSLKNACHSFLNTSSSLKAEYSIVGFETTAKTYIENSSDLASLNNTIDNLKDLGSTNIEAGLQESERIFNNQSNTKKTIVLMSDGLPNEGKTGSALESYAESLKNKDICIYTLGFFHSISGSKSEPQNLMTNIASNGCRYDAGSSTDLQNFFNDISHRIQGQTDYNIEAHCPVDITVTYNGETLSSIGASTTQRTSFGSLIMLDEAGTTTKSKIVRLKEGPSYDISITGNGVGTMNYSIGYVNARGQYDDTRYFDNISVNSKTKISTKANLTDTNEMTVDANGDGQNVIKYAASSNEHAKIVNDQPQQSPTNQNDDTQNNQEIGFFEALFRTLSRMWNDFTSNIWYHATQQ